MNNHRWTLSYKVGTPTLKLRFPLSWEVNMTQKPSIPKGTRDFNPEEVAKRQYIISTIKQQFERFGFQPIETPSFENSETLMGKYGDEGDRLIFKILNSGDYFEEVRNDVYYSANITNVFFDTFDALLITLDKGKVENYGASIIRILEFYSKRFISDKEADILSEFFTNLKAKLISFSNLDEKEKPTNLIPFRRECFDSFFKNYINNFDALNSSKATKVISEKALRYDLTVPFARYVVQHQNEIDFPFKRYQIQPVWRADRPQKGRFREFYQCDADVVGSDSLWQEVEFIQLYDSVFTALQLEGVTIKINNRKILSGIAEVIGAHDKLIDFTVALDKLDKIGEDKVKEEMLVKGISADGIEKLQPLFSLSGDFDTQIQLLKAMLSTSVDGLKGITELEFISKAIQSLNLKTAKLELDVTLARGLNYYTGAIFEVAAPKSVSMGSIGGGGRYDDLTGIFGLNDISGVGISFGLDRIYLVLEVLNLFPETVTNATRVLFINFGEKEALHCLKIIQKLRQQNINAELYPDDAKMKKQMNYANKRNIPYVVLVGEAEINANSFTLKNMISGTQDSLSESDLIKVLQ